MAGSIIWARAFLQRLKESVLQFKCMPAFFQSYEAEVVFTNYLNLARQLVAYQDTLFKRWQVCTDKEAKATPIPCPGGGDTR